MGIYLKYYNNATKQVIIETIKKDMEGAQMADVRVKQLSSEDIVGLNEQFDEMWENAHSTEAHFNSGMRQGLEIGVQKEKLERIQVMLKNEFSEEVLLDLEYTQEEINQAKHSV